MKNNAINKTAIIKESKISQLLFDLLKGQSFKNVLYGQVLLTDLLRKHDNFRFEL